MLHVFRWLAPLSLLVATSAFGQAWTRDPNFNPVLRNDVSITNLTFSATPDRRVLVYGSFDYLLDNSFQSHGVAYLQPDGTPDGSFHSAAGNPSSVETAAPLGDGGVLVHAWSTNGRMLLKLRRDGSVDPSVPSRDVPYAMRLLALDSGSVLAYGSYLKIDGQFYGAVARFGSDGTLDPTFVCGLPNTLSDVPSVAVQTSGMIVAAEMFSRNGVTTGRLVRLTTTGQIDPTFTPYDASTAILNVVIQPDGKIIANTGTNLLRFLADGAPDGSVQLGITNVQWIDRVVGRTDGSLVLQARIGTGASPWPASIFVLDSSGTVLRDTRQILGTDQTFQLGTVERDGSIILVHGVPNYINPPLPPDVYPFWYPGPPDIVPANPVVKRLSPDGATARPIDLRALYHAAASPGSLYVDAASRLLITGTFTRVNDVPRPGLARFTAAGDLDATYVPDAPDEKPDRLLLIGADDSVLTARFTTAAATEFHLIRRRSDGTLDPNFAPAPAYRSPGVAWRAVAADGNFVVSRFTPDNLREENLRIEWVSAAGQLIRALPTQFSTWTKLPVVGPGSTPTDPGYGDPIRFAQPLPGGKLLVGGQFQKVNGANWPWLVRLNSDGSVDSTYHPDVSGFSDAVQPSTVDDQGKVSVYGSSNATGQPTWIRYRLLADGSRDSSFDYSGPPLYLPGPVFHDAALWRDDGLPDVTFPTTYLDANGSHASISTAVRSPNGIVWTGSPFARFIPADSPGISVPPADVTTSAGHDALFLVGMSTRHPATYQWTFKGADIPGATHSYLTLYAVTPQQSGTYAVRATVDNQTFTSATAYLTVTGGAARMINFSGRAIAKPMAPIVAGFVIAGDGAPRPWLIRGVGPTLARFGVTSPLPDPTLTLYRGTTHLIDNTGGILDADITELSRRVGAFAAETGPIFVPEWRTKESALAQPLTTGAYTANVQSASNESGPALVEVYDSYPGGASGALQNASLRSDTGPGAEIETLGFVITGDSALQVLIRGIGPTLNGFGIPNAITDPRISVSRVNAANGGWTDAPEIAAAAKTVGAFPLRAGSRDAALLMRLDPGSYTVQLTSASGSRGTGLIEVYVLPH